MNFLSPTRLVLLLAPLALVAAYVVVQFQRKRYAVRFSNVDLLASVAPKRPGWRRHVAAGLILASLSALVVAFAQPTREVKVPKERATVMLALDVSLSMQATDVKPARIDAAKTAAKLFVDAVPKQFRIGLVAFAGSARVVLPPTVDREQMHATIDKLELDEGTAIGEAIYASLNALEDADANEKNPPPAHIVLMSDGKTTTGRPNDRAVTAAKEQKVPIDTIAFGTDGGVVELRGEQVPVPVDRQALADIAAATGGKSFNALSRSEVESVFKRIGSSIGYDTKQEEVTVWWLGAGIFVLILGCGAALVFTNRLP